MKLDTDAPAPITICVPTYNGERYIAQCIDSILAQSYPRFELVVVDDASTDRTVEILERFDDPRLRIVRNPKRLGLVANWNRCLEFASAQFVCLFHQDDEMFPRNLERKIEILEEHKRVGIVYSRVAQVDASGQEREVNRLWSSAAAPTDCILPGSTVGTSLFSGENFISCPSVVARRECFELVGAFNSRLHYTADFEMWMRISLIYDVAYLAEPLVKYRWHDSNETWNYSGRPEGLQQRLEAKALVVAKSPDHFPRRIRREAIKHDLSLAVSEARLAHDAHDRATEADYMKIVRDFGGTPRFLQLVALHFYLPLLARRARRMSSRFGALLKRAGEPRE